MPAALVPPQVDDGAALLGGELERGVELRAAVAPGGAEGVAGQALGVHADHRRLGQPGGRHERHVLGARAQVAVAVDAEVAVLRRQVRRVGRVHAVLGRRGDGRLGRDVVPVLRAPRDDVLDGQQDEALGLRQLPTPRPAGSSCRRRSPARRSRRRAPGRRAGTGRRPPRCGPPGAARHRARPAAAARGRAG